MRKIVTIIFIISFCSAVYGQSGTPDPTFGNNGYIKTPAATIGSPSSQMGVQCFIQPDGKLSIVLQVGVKTMITRRLSNGLPDITYGNNGYSEIVSLVVTSAAIQTDGKIVVAGTTNGSSDFMLARYESDGTIDSSFGNKGVTITDIGSATDFLNKVTIASDGRILAAGTTVRNGVNEFVLVGYTTGGTPDYSFGDNSIAITDFDGMSSSASSIVLQPDGKILAVGTVYTPSGSDFALARYNADGGPDFSFNSTGRVYSDFDLMNDRATSIILDNAGQIYAGGMSADLSGFQHFRVARYNTDGSLDLSYNGGAGFVTAIFGDSYDDLINIRLQIDGTLIAAGHTNLNVPNSDIEIIHINSDGTIDQSFGNNGLVRADVNGAEDESNFLVIQNDGKIITGGANDDFTTNPLSFYFSCFRFNANGTPDVNFGNNGSELGQFPGTSSNYTSLFVQDDGKLMASSQSLDGDTSKYYLSRFNPDGKANGIKQLASGFNFSAFQPDGKLVGLSFSTTNNGDFLIIRYNADGSPDTGFGTDDSVISDFGGNESAETLAFQADGKIIVGGISRDESGTDLLIARYNTDGSIDGSFGTNGSIRINFVIEDNLQNIVIAPDGKIVLAGNRYIYPPDFSFFHANVIIARLNPDGTLDNSFANQGTLIVDPDSDEFLGSMAVQNDGKIVFIFSSNSANAVQGEFMERLNPDGSSDLNFGQSGKVNCDGFLLNIQADQKILVSGSIVDNRNNSDLSIARFSKDGIPDSSFGNNSKSIVSFTGVDNYITSTLLNGKSLFTIGNGMDTQGLTAGIIAKFLLETPVSITCPGNKVVVTDSGLCSAKVYEIDPAPGCRSDILINYSLAGATTGNGTCSATGTLFNKGTTTVTYSLASDATKFCSFTVAVQDKELPSIKNLRTSVSTLWQPDHEMRDVYVANSINDNCEISNTAISVASNEPARSNERRDLFPDWQIIDSHHIRLRAERLESGNGRVYTIKVTATDVSGNQYSKTTVVTVPKNRGRNCNLDVSATPNPGHSYFTVTVRSNCDDKINIRIFNNRGDVISTINNITAPAVLKIGDNLRPGIYYLEANQSGISKVIKLVKQ